MLRRAALEAEVVARIGGNGWFIPRDEVTGIPTATEDNCGPPNDELPCKELRIGGAPGAAAAVNVGYPPTIIGWFTAA